MTNVYIGVEASGCGEDIVYWILDKQQMDEVDAHQGADYCEAMSEVIDKYNLSSASGARHGTFKSAMDHLIANNLTLVEDFNYIAY